ncbi:efflux RND transporter periplasmic adaptor subunit [Maricaulis maris]|uniref:Multidrug efflux system membrane fusion protein n=1 Tax=Maricaulis maris TaxID=74318 RepID=A0A495D2X0_9PROT|nr:efflux RND transporter periplasmic adaptor subunit [Maricaulis maris]RKQ96118.1 multidrug efflux system membrane fusion protein [Maricaulis maris]
MKLNTSYLSAAGIFVAVVLLFTLGTVFRSDAVTESDASAGDQPLFEVVTRTVTAAPRPAELRLRGRTEAIRAVTVRAETGGRVVEAPILEGSPVSAGDVVCRLDVDARGAAVDQAEAELRTRQLEYDAAAELLARGHRSANQVAAAEAVRDAARAQLRAAREELANIELRVPFDGYFDGRDAEIGDFLRTGDACGTVLQLDPILIIAEVAERDVGSLQPGMPGTARLLSGQQVDGTIRFVERRANPATRTFRVELEVPNPDGAIRSGVTAEIRLNLAPEPAHRVPASILALDSNGDLGVRIIEDGDTVRFLPIELLSDDGEQVWISGLPETADVIVLGQDFVSDGTRVEVRPEGAGR